ncbi:MAG: hypothetical protein H6865_00085 [Rhodospirillales bacterium]|nr:hypothetical protein [Alphaproteobacteria bacterium]MCB9986023.1 hypothetical protein [Rhodospirillales bacterium]USO07403.1 MAG: hypothetical protein H6866_08285 [Rhodospirillales bacterium]
MTGLLFETCIPLAILIAVGFMAGKYQPTDMKSVPIIAIYGITPLVGLGAAAQMHFTPQLALLPFVTFFLAALVAGVSMAVGRIALTDAGQRYLLPVACGSGNTGYFGLPIVLALFGDKAAGVYFLANLGVSIFETTIGYYFIVRGTTTPRAAFVRVARLPLIYALAAGLVLSGFDVALPAWFLKLWGMTKGAYAVVGMMIAGLALAQQPGFTLNPRLLGVTVLGRFVFWPCAALGFGWLDAHLLHWFDSQTDHLLIVLSLVPVAANLPAYAATVGSYVKDCALLVLISTIAAIIGLPFILPLLL